MGSKQNKECKMWQGKNNENIEHGPEYGFASQTKVTQLSSYFGANILNSVTLQLKTCLLSHS